MKEDGTVNRAALPAIFNPEDLNALEMALHIKDNIKDATIKQIEESALDANRNKDILIEQIKLSASTTVESNQ